MVGIHQILASSLPSTHFPIFKIASKDLLLPNIPMPKLCKKDTKYKDYLTKTPSSPQLLPKSEFLLVFLKNID
jgi:hypothetical protein